MEALDVRITIYGNNEALGSWYPKGGAIKFPGRLRWDFKEFLYFQQCHKNADF